QAPLEWLGLLGQMATQEMLERGDHEEQWDLAVHEGPGVKQEVTVQTGPTDLEDPREAQVFQEQIPHKILSASTNNQR
ncbi:hypothetical protein, partial [Salmonella sp. s51933]|uniref:hypothetical protein n=1 Tax=Salmonella sp. s51933 TaxID=3160127 RepID=UPI003754E426